MSKDYIRDYATEAFRFYARNGMSAEQYKQKIYNEALVNMEKRKGNIGVSCPTEAAIIRAENEVDRKMAEIKDIEAVEMTLNELTAMMRRDMIKAIEIVYFEDANKDMKLGDVQDRVHKAGLDIPASERTIYRWLRRVRDLFALKRGLRIEKIYKGCQ